MSQNWSKQTKLIHEGSRRSQYNEVSEAIFMTQGFVYETAEQAKARFEKSSRDEFIYARYGNPTVAMFEDRMAGLEGAEDAFATASGMAAVNGALMAFCRAGDHVVAARALFGSCLYILEDILPRMGVHVTFIDGCDLDAWRSAVTSKTKLVFFETIANPTLEVVDIAAVAEIAHANGALVVVDNVFSTPVYSRAIEQGVDLVIYSTTKHVDGQGRALGGVICGSQELIRKSIEPFLKHTGAAMSPFTAWIMLKGLETIALRVAAQTQSAYAIADRFVGHDALARLIYPGHPSHPDHALVLRQSGAGGTVLSFELKGRERAAFSFLNALKIVRISNNLGDAKSIATHPATTTHQRLSQEQRDRLGISEGLVRFSVGLEDQGDLLEDVAQALKVSCAN